MNQSENRQYPIIFQAIHLIILYIFIETLVNFPLAIIDYINGTEYLYNPVKKIIVGYGSVIFILWYGFRNTKNPLKDVFPLKKFNALIPFLLVVFFIGAHQLLNIVNFWINKAIPPPMWFWELFDKVFENQYGFWGTFMKVAVVAPITEELIFRGVIMHGLMRNYSKFTAIFFSGLLFALFHLNPWQFPATFVLGVLLGWLMIYTRNILLSIGGHAINNLLVLLGMRYDSELRTAVFEKFDASMLNIIAAIMIVVSVLLMAICVRKRGQNKLPG